MPDAPEANEPSQDLADTFTARSKAFYEISRARLDEQSRWVSTLDARLATTFGLGAVIVALFAASLVIGQEGLPRHSVVSSVFVLALFVAATFCGYMAFR